MGQKTNIFARLYSSNTFIVSILILFILATIITGFATFSRVKAMVLAGSIFLPEPTGFASRTTAAPTQPGDPTATPTVPGPTGPQPIPWDGASRVTALVMGLDYGDWASEDRDGTPRTDTMILLSLDPVSKSAAILNIPRDLWVNIPGFKPGKINTAYPQGEDFGYPGGGPGLAIKTVEEFLGIPINFFALVDFYAFEDFIDEIGGIEIEVPEEIKVDPIGEHNTVVLEAGKQHLDGPVALAYARARYTDGGDFDRGARQQQVIMAMLKQVLKADRLPSLITKAPTLYAELSGGINTNMSLEQAIALAWMVPSIDLENGIKRGVIGPPKMVVFAKSPDGKQDILKPVTSEIRNLRDELFASNTMGPAGAEADPVELLAGEGAKLSVLNGSGAPGLAQSTSDYLTEQGANVVVTADAGQYYTYTSVVVYSGAPYTLSYLVELMNIQENQIRMEYNPNSEVDLVVYLGGDWAAKNPMSGP